MFTHPLSLLLLTMGQLGLPSDDSSRDALDAPALPRFEQPESLQISPSAEDSPAASRPPWSSESIYGQGSGNSSPQAPITSPSAPVSSPPASLNTPAAPLAPERLGPADDFSATSTTESNAAKTLLQQTLRAPSEAAIDGTPVALQKVVRQTRAREQQIAAVRAYWRLSEELAAYYFAIDESRFFRDLPLPQVAHQRALLTSREASAKARAATSHLATIQAQHELAKMAPLGLVGEVPLPADTPFVGVYQTHFKVLNDRGVAPDVLRPIDQMLPAMRASVQALAEAVLAADDALAATRQAYETGQATLQEVLGMHEQLRRQRREFLSAVSQYNEQIARYAFSVSLPGATTDRVVGMLIETPGAMRSVLASQQSDSDVRRVSNEEEVDEWSSPREGNR